MLNFRQTSAVFLILATLFALGSLYYPLLYWAIAGLALLYITMLVRGSIYIQHGFYVKALCRVKTEDRIISLSFDDGPNPRVTPMVLDLLKEHDIKAAFFCIGKRVIENPEIMRRMKEEGHLIGNHSYSHTSLFDFWGNQQMQRDIEKAEKFMALATGQRPEWFRPPFGVTNPTVASLVNRKKYKVMGWSVRSLDTTIKDKDKTVERIKKRWHPGGIILLHDTHNLAVDILEEIIKHGKSEGYNFIRADEMENYK